MARAHAIEAILAAKAFYGQGFHVISRKFMIIARVPPNGLKKLRSMARTLGKERAEDFYRRVHASGPNRVTLDSETYAAFQAQAWKELEVL